MHARPCVFSFWHICLTSPMKQRRKMTKFGVLRMTSAQDAKRLRPGQTLATFQHNILQHCCMMLRQLLNGLAKRTQHSSQHVAVYEPTPLALGCRPKISMEDFEWNRASGPSAHALAQQCSWTWPIEYNIMQHPKCCTKNLTVFKFDPTSSNMLQHIATYRNRVAKVTQHVVPNNVARCCAEMLRAFGQAFT